MTRYYIAVLGWYTNSEATEKKIIECDGVDVCERGDYMFWNYESNGVINAVSHYPIRNTIIYKIEKL